MDRETNCPNCGAPKRGSVCEYCGVHFGRSQGQVSIEVDADVVSIYDWSGSVLCSFVRSQDVNVKIVDESGEARG